MSYFTKAELSELDKVTLEYRRGGMSRRTFVQQAMALGATVGMAGALATAWSSKAFAQQSTKTAPKPAGTYDYIIIGSGSAGSALTHQLVTQSGASVLLLEAGRNDDLKEVHDPLLWIKSLGTDAAKWFETTPQNYTDGRVHLWPRGNVLGGTSCLNAMIFGRGHQADYDSWAYAGNYGWSYKEVLKHFIDMETFEPRGENRGTKGPLFISQPANGLKHPGAQSFMDACAKLGFKETPSINSGRLEGQAWVDFNIKDHQRQSGAVAFLYPLKDKKNLTILVDAPVTKLKFKGSTCTGVSYLHGTEEVTVSASREVILSAGALDSPRLLMLSGIGPAADLKALGIEMVADLPVGIGLQDHVVGGGPNWETKGPIPVSNYNSSEVYMWERSDSRLPVPDVTLFYISAPFASPGHKLEYKDGYAIASGVVRPQSRGYLKLKSKDFNDKPIIEINYLKEEQDRKALRWSTELAREVGNSEAYASVRKRETLPQKPNLSEAEWREFINKSVVTFFHPTSTCRMGVGAEAVVDPELRVRGIQGLRVADASIMPEIVSTNTNAPSMMIGWKCGDMLSVKA